MNRRLPARKSRPATRAGLKPGQVKLERALSKLGIASRTQARSWIQEGRVKVDGITRRSPDFALRPETARIEIQGIHSTPKTFRTFAFHKPRGTLTTRSDEKNRPTVFDLLPPNLPYLIAVGRLDMATSGLLLFTNDTRFADYLTDPRSQIPRVYVVTVQGQVTTAELEALRRGQNCDGEFLKPIAAELRKTSTKESHLILTLTEGKNREVRRICEGIGHPVTLLKRVSYGSLQLEKLEPGTLREISMDELQAAFPEYSWTSRRPR